MNPMHAASSKGVPPAFGTAGMAAGTDEVLKSACDGRKNEICVSVKRQNNMQDHAGI